MKDYPTEDEICFAVAETFTKTAERTQQRILGALVPYSLKPTPMISYWPEYEIEELCQFVNQFNSYITDDVELSKKARIMLLIYCHIMEAHFPATVLWNLIRLLAEEFPSWDFYGIGKRGKKFSCELPRDRYAQIEKLAKAQNVQIGTVLQRLWHNKLRNAYSHAQYIVHKNGDFLGGKNISPITESAVRKGDTAKGAGGENPYYYRFEDIYGLYNSVIKYLRSFVESYRFIVTPFKTGDFFDIPAGCIRWNVERKRWTTS